jgi:acyl-CoA thioesterase-1
MWSVLVAIGRDERFGERISGYGTLMQRSKGAAAAFLASLTLVTGLWIAAPGGEAAAADRPMRVVALGDSLTAGYGLPAADAFPVRLQAALRARGHVIEIENAGVSGDTASGGRDRLDWSVPDGTDAVIVELGANDALRGIDPTVTRAALDDILSRLAARRIPVLFAGMLAPVNMGTDYRQHFDAIFPDLAKRHDVVFYPFFLDGVVAERSLNLADGIHPNARGVAVIVERILPASEQLIDRIKARRGS